MARKGGVFSEVKIQKWIKEGRGSGRNHEYKQWLKVGDFSSQGRSHRIYGYKSWRTHHLFSDLELAVFFILEWKSHVLEVREQFPLQREVTIELAKMSGIKHPEVAGVLHNMSSDFLIDSMNPDLPRFAIQAKYTNELSNHRVIKNWNWNAVIGKVKMYPGF